MPGVHTYLQNTLTYKFTLHPWPRIMNSAGKEVRVTTMNRCTGRHCRPVLQLPTGQFSQLANCWYDTVDPGAHGMEQGKAKQNEQNGGKN